MAEQKQNPVELIMKDIAYLDAKQQQMTSNLIENLIRENQMLQQQYQMAMKKIEELTKADKKPKK